MKSPILQKVNELHPMLDFDENSYYVGFLLDTPYTDKETGDEKIKKVLWVKNDKELFLPDYSALKFKKVELGSPLLRITPSLLDGDIDRMNRMDEIDQSVMSLGLEPPNNKTYIKTAFEYIRNLYAKYIDFSDNDIYDFITCWTIGTYFHPIFNSYPYVHVHGLSQTGKTQVLDITKLIAFNAIGAGNLSDSALYRLIESLRPVLIIDETDLLADKKNRPAFHALLLNGYKKGGEVWRTEKKSQHAVTYTPQSFAVYGPKMTANIEGLEKVLGSRTIRITMWRSKTEKPEAKESEEWQIARDLCYISLFNNWKDIASKHKTLDKIDRMINRDLELWKPILTVASVISNEVFERVKTFALKKIEENKNSVNVESSEYKLVKALYRQMDETDKWFNLSDVKLAWMNEFEEGEGTWITANATSNNLERLGIRKVRMYLGKKQYLIESEFLKELITRLNINTSDIKPLIDRKISHLNDKILDFIKTKNAPNIKEIREYFTNLGVNEIEVEHAIDKLKNNGLILEKTPGRYEKV